MRRGIRMELYLLEGGSIIGRDKEDTLWKERHRGVSSMQNDPDLSRDFLVQLWLADRQKMRLSGKRRHKILKSIDNGATLVNGRTLPKLFDRIVSGKYDVDEKSYDKIKSSFKQPPTSQSITGTLEPMSLAENKVAPLLARSSLLITRDIEWANLVLGFEQENRYAIVDICYPHAVLYVSRAM